MTAIIDSHTHLWHCNGVYFEWIDEESPIHRDFLIHDLEKVLATNSVTASLVVQAIPEIEETKWLLDIARESHYAKGVIGWVDIGQGSGVNDDLDELMRHSSLLKGIRYMSQGLDPSHLYTSEFIEGVKAVGQRGLVYELLITASQLTAAHKLISVCPDVQFVIEHIAKPKIREGNIERWQKEIRTIANDFDNVACKVSGVVTEANLFSWRQEDIQPYLATVFESFGMTRTLFGSDWPVCLLATTYQEWLLTLNQFFVDEHLPDTNAFYGANAQRIYQL